MPWGGFGVNYREALGPTEGLVRLEDPVLPPPPPIYTHTEAEPCRPAHQLGPPGPFLPRRPLLPAPFGPQTPFRGPPHPTPAPAALRTGSVCLCSINASLCAPPRHLKTTWCADVGGTSAPLRPRPLRRSLPHCGRDFRSPATPLLLLPAPPPPPIAL